MPSSPGSRPLSLGSFTFGSEECPDKLPIGALEDRKAVTEYAGGGREVQHFGVQPKQVAWSGRFHEDVDSKIQALRAIMVAEQEVLLTWGPESYYCTIDAFVPGYKHEYWCEYEITVEITRDANGAFTTASAPTVDDAVSGLADGANTSFTTILTSDNSSAASALSQPLTDLNVSIRQSGPLAQASQSSVLSLLGSVNTALQAAQGYLGGLDSRASTFFPASQLVNALTLIQRNVLAGQTVQQKRVSGGNLFDLSAAQYGDVEAAFALADVNGKGSPFLPGAVLQEIGFPPLPGV